MSEGRQAGTAERLWQRAESYLAQRNLPAARAAFETLVASEPGHVMARLRLSTLATAQGRYRDSVTQLLEIARLRPDEPALLVLLAGMLHRLGESRAAIDCLAHPGLAGVRDRALLQQAAQLASQLEQAELALALLDRAEALGGPDPGTLYTRATLATFAGDLHDAERALLACLAQAPRHAQAHWALSRVRRQTPQANHVERLRGLLAAESDPTPVAYLGYALFKELDDLGRTDEAWQALEQACQARRRQLPPRAEEEAAAFACLHRLRGTGTSHEATSSDADARADANADADAVDGHGQPVPIFIVGMPRTGTTLLERILGGDPRVENAGELDDFPLQLRWCANRFSKTFLDPAVLDLASAQDPRLLGRRYLEHAAWRARGKPFFTDKMPPNFLHVGLIARALPQARILHMTRHPMDTCFSNLKELFAEAYPYSYDQGELAAHYGRYRRLMAHWHEQFPGRVLDVSYEGLVADPVSWSQQVFRHCGLDWRPEVVRIESSGGAVTTASSVQVREPIHQRGVDGWRRYERQLQPLQSLLRADGWLP